MSITGLRNRIGPYDRGTFRADIVAGVTVQVLFQLSWDPRFLSSAGVALIAIGLVVVTGYRRRRGHVRKRLRWSALAVVMVAVAAFLTLLVTLVSKIDRRVDEIRATLDQAETNTADTALIAETGDGLDAVLSEGLEHHLFLGRVLDQVRS